MANMDRDLWHVSMNEGLITSDLDADNPQIVSWDRCVERGYREELGIAKHHQIVKNEYCDLFMVKENYN